jgi:hypothetical protein
MCAMVGFAWHKGTSDKCPVERAIESKSNLPDFIGDVRAEPGKPDLPFVIATAGMTDACVEPSPYPGYSMSSGRSSGRSQNLPAEATSAAPKPAASGRMPPCLQDQGFHWNGNARSHFKVGKALGDDMVELLTPTS